MTGQPVGNKFRHSTSEVNIGQKVLREVYCSPKGLPQHSKLCVLFSKYLVWAPLGVDILTQLEKANITLGFAVLTMCVPRAGCTRIQHITAGQQFVTPVSRVLGAL